MKKVSVYVKGNRNAPTYYRIYQYLDKIQECQFRYNQMYADWVHDRFMPFSKQPLYIRIFALIHAYFRMLFSLLLDCITKPDVLIIHRRVLVRYMPYSYKFLLNKIAKRSKIIWDFDDNILENKEVSYQILNFYANVSSNIIVTHEFLKDLLPDIYKKKVFIMPTTDGDMYKDFLKNSQINLRRLESIDKVIELVWVATSVNLPHLENIVEELDNAARILRDEYSKELILNVVCDAPLTYESNYLTINNIKWTHNIAIDIIYRSHIGIMPLSDNNFTKGKGGFKLIQYMSAGLPCIASNVGYNSYVISSNMGRLVDKNSEWTDAILFMSDKMHWVELSKCAYSNWQSKFSFEQNLDNWVKFIQLNTER